MTNWVTIRVPESDRDEAKDVRPDDATHGDCLVAGAKALAGQDTESVATEADAHAVAEAIKGEISMANEPGVEIDAERIINRIDDLETELTRQHEGLKR